MHSRCPWWCVVWLLFAIFPGDMKIMPSNGDLNCKLHGMTLTNFQAEYCNEAIRQCLVKNYLLQSKYALCLVGWTRPSLISLHLHHFSSINVLLSHFPHCLIFIIPLPLSPSLPRPLSSASSAPTLLQCLPGGAAAAWTCIGPEVPDGLAGRGFRTDPSAADRIPPQTPGGPGGYTLLKQNER